MKNSLFIAILLAVILFVTACSSPTPTPTEVKLPALPTPDVPPIEEVDAALVRLDTDYNSFISMLYNTCWR